MRNQETWATTKFVPSRDGGWRASRDKREVNPASRVHADAFAAAYVRALKRYAGGRLLDLGCGSVPLYGAYRSLVTETTCIDWPATSHRSPHLDFEADISQPLDLPAGSFDTILLSDVLEHLPTPAATMAEMARLLAPGGHVVIGSPFLYWIHEQPHDYGRHTEFSLRRLCEEASLPVVSLEPIGSGVHVVVDLTAKILSQTRLRALVPAEQAAGAGLVRVLPAEWLARMGRLLPSGYLVVAAKADADRTAAPA